MYHTVYQLLILKLLHYSDEESSGVSASYTVGGITIAAVFNSTDTVAGSAGTDKEFKEISVAFAF